MKALSLWQPWASLIAVGAKTIETRGWSTTYRGPLLVHAGKGIARLDEARAAWNQWDVDVYCATRATEAPSKFSTEFADSLPIGAVVATCDLVDVVPMIGLGDYPPERGGWLSVGPRAMWARGVDHNREVTDQLPYGDFTPGRYAWLLANIRPLAASVPARGRQGLWTPDADLITAVEAARG